MVHKQNHKIFTFVAISLCFLFILAGSLVSLHRYWQYESFFYDFGIFDQAIWNVAHRTAPIIDHLVIGGKWIFADHFNPSIFLLVPLYWITNHREILLVAQSCFVGLSGLVIYLIGVETLKNKFYALAIMLNYYLFTGLQNAVITDFHEVTLATLPLACAYLAIIKKKISLFFLFLVLTLGFKESNYLLGVGIGISIYFINKSYLKVAILACIISLLWGYIAISHIIPYFSGGLYQYGVDVSYNPIHIMQTFFDNDVKRHTTFYSLASFGFLPLLSLPFYFLMFQDLLVRFYAPYATTRWGLGLHYSAQLSVIMAIASCYSLMWIIKKIHNEKIIHIFMVILFLSGMFLYRFILRGPFALAYNPAFYAHSKDFKFLDDLVQKIPRGASVMAQNNLAVRFTHQQMWTLQSSAKKFTPDYYVQKQPEYIVIDAREGQNPNNYFLVDNMKYLLSELQKDSNYVRIYASDYQFIYKRLSQSPR